MIRFQFRKIFLITTAFAFASPIQVNGQIVDRPTISQPIRLEALIPKLDDSVPESKKLLKGAITDTYNPEVLEIPRSGSAKAYEVGLKLFNEGDYQRSLNAFTLAMIRGAKYGMNDPRYKNAKLAMKSAESKLTLAAKLGYKTDNSDAKALTGKVEKVFQPSLSWLSGLKKGDLIIKANVQADHVMLTVKRDNKIYHLKLRLRKKKALDLKSLTPKKEVVRAESTVTEEGKITNTAVLEQKEKLLGDYDCALLIDNSSSMAAGLMVKESTNFIGSKWDWLRDNSVDFYRQTRNYFPRGLTLVPFNHAFAVARDAGTSDIQEVFQKLKPSGGTNISAPLAFVLDDYFKRRAAGRVKPIAIAVLTDGQDSLSRLRDVVLDATMRMKNKDEIKITFLHIGSEFFRSQTLRALDDDLVDAGAAYDIVDTRYFDELLKYGLKKSLVAALVEAQAEGSK